MDEVLRVSLLVAAIFEDLGAKYFIGGSVASSVHGIPRTTHDVDFVVDLQPKHVKAFVHALGASFYADETTIMDAVRGGKTFNVLHQESMLKIDVFVGSGNRRFAEEARRRQKFQASPATDDALWVASPEDIVLEKLRWYLLGNRTSERQLEDIVGVLRIHKGSIDLAYLRENVADPKLLEELLVRAARD